jgi:myo-inositol 2-dehydrogenase / D-chiro-inositol 1-dehydrogenase
VRNDGQPLETGEEGRKVLEVIFAAYESTGTGRKVALPFTPPVWAHSPIHCWKPWLSPDCPPELRDEGG